jgi:hypothetical protein
MTKEWAVGTAPHRFPADTSRAACTLPQPMSTEAAVPHIPTMRMFRLFFWLHWRSFSARFTKSRRESPCWRSSSPPFVIGYLLFGFLLFRARLEYLRRFPLIGAQLTDRIPFLIFGFLLRDARRSRM